MSRRKVGEKGDWDARRGCGEAGAQGGRGAMRQPTCQGRHGKASCEIGSQSSQGSQGSQAGKPGRPAAQGQASQSVASDRLSLPQRAPYPRGGNASLFQTALGHCKQADKT